MHSPVPQKPNHPSAQETSRPASARGKAYPRHRRKIPKDVYWMRLKSATAALIPHRPITMKKALGGGESLFFSHYDPKTVEWFMSIL